MARHPANHEWNTERVLEEALTRYVRHTRGKASYSGYEPSIAQAYRERAFMAERVLEAVKRIQAEPTIAQLEAEVDRAKQAYNEMALLPSLARRSEAGRKWGLAEHALNKVRGMLL